MKRQRVKGTGPKPRRSARQMDRAERIKDEVLDNGMVRIRCGGGHRVIRKGLSK